MEKEHRIIVNITELAKDCTIVLSDKWALDNEADDGADIITAINYGWSPLVYTVHEIFACRHTGWVRWYKGRCASVFMQVLTRHCDNVGNKSCVFV